jgi:DNA polymerase elongation subunit (family B)
MASPLTTYIRWLATEGNVPFPEECKSLKISSILSLAEEDFETSIVLNQLFNNPYAYKYSIEDIAKVHKKYNTIYKFNYIPVKPVFPKIEEKPKKKETDVVINKKSKYKLYSSKEKEDSKPTDGYSKPMLFNFYSDYVNKEFAYVIRVGDKRYITQTDDMVMMYTGKDDYLDVHDIAGLKGELVHYGKRKYIIEQIQSESSYKAIYNVDFNLAIHKNYLWKKENKDNLGHYKLRVNYVDIELYQEGYGIIDFADIKKSARVIPVNLITLYDNYTDKYYTLVYNLNKAKINTEQIKEYLDYKDECIFNVEIFDKESDMFLKFFSLLKEFDPDLVSGWNSDEFDLPYIKYRAEFLGIEHPKLAHNKTFEIEYKTVMNKHEEEVTYCIPHIGYSVALDYQRCYKERTLGKKENYKLGTISKIELGITKLDTEDGMDKIFREEPERFIAYNINDVHLVRKLDEKLKYIDLNFSIVQLANISWDSIYTTLHICDGILYEYLMDRDKVAKIVKAGIEKKKFAGAYVREPISGVHDWLGDLDLTSLYPYIMARYNISADTYVGKVDTDTARQYIFNKEEFVNSNTDVSLYLKVQGIERLYKLSAKSFHERMLKNGYIITQIGTIFKKHEDKQSVLYDIVDMLIKKRKEYKDLMKDNIGKDQMLVDRYDTMQKTVKIITNSLYGGQSNIRFRLYDYEVARSITSTGREIAKIAAVVANNCINQMIQNKSNKFDHVDIPFDWDYQSEQALPNVIYGDSVTGDSLIRTGKGNITIKELWDMCASDNKVWHYLGKNYIQNPNKCVLGYDDRLYFPRYLMKHKTNKKLYKITTESGKTVTVTEDHSLVVMRNNVKTIIKPTELVVTDQLITL